MSDKPKVLIACEFSGVVMEAFVKQGIDAYSCDLLPTESKLKHRHIQDDVLKHLDDGWDMMIAHPPCTWLCQAMRTNAARRDRPEISSKFETERSNAFDFVMKLYNADIPRIAIENPIGYLNQAWRKPEQILRPFMFGHPYKKDICFYLKNLPLLNPTCALFDTGRKTLDYWSSKRNPDGKSLKSITFPGIADAMANQWGNYLIQAVNKSRMELK